MGVEVFALKAAWSHPADRCAACSSDYLNNLSISPDDAKVRADTIDETDANSKSLGEFLCRLGVRGVLTLLGLHHTVGSVNQLPAR